MAITNIPVWGDNAGATGDPIYTEANPYPYNTLAGDPTPYIPFDIVPPGDYGTTTGIDHTEPVWTTGTITYTLPTPDTKEAITILEEAEYELKGLLKKTIEHTPLNGKSHKQLIDEALRDTQRALRALLKVC